MGENRTGGSVRSRLCIDKDGTILAVEVKAGEKGSLKSLHFLLQKYHQIEQAIVFSKSQSGNIEKIKFVPLYKVGVI